MKRLRFGEVQVIAMLKWQEAGMSTADGCRKQGITSATFCKDKAEYGGPEVSDARLLRVLGTVTRSLGSAYQGDARQYDPEGYRGKISERPV